MAEPSPWRLRARTVEAMAALFAARIAVAVVPLRWWQGLVGLAGRSQQSDQIEARRLAVHIDRAAARLPLTVKCLPRALALGAMLRRRRVAHRVVLACRPAQSRARGDDLHAWLDVEGHVVLGALPGPWMIVLVLPQDSSVNLAFPTKTGDGSANAIDRGDIS